MTPAWAINKKKGILAYFGEEFEISKLVDFLMDSQFLKYRPGLPSQPSRRKDLTHCQMCRPLRVPWFSCAVETKKQIPLRPRDRLPKKGYHASSSSSFRPSF
jgi:hypothetical protein